jgi:hypothetical protein
MKPALVKIDVAHHITGMSVRQLFEMADGGTLLHKALLWVFDFSNGEQEQRRELRFWRPELEARAEEDPRRHHKFAGYELDWVLNRILPPKIENFQAGLVDDLFQIRPRTRIDFGAELNGEMTRGRNFYAREVLVAFLAGRHLLRNAPRFHVEQSAIVNCKS